ncbi:MAG: cell division protein FtsW [Anaerolineae bacterium]|nr:cell division protein FtsW [Anaerolineae bacterium]
MADSLPQFTEADIDLDIPASARRTRIFKASEATAEIARPVERRRTFLSTIDLPLLVLFGLLIAIGSLMIYSTTFDWSYQDYGSDTYIFMQHVRNLAIGGSIFVLLTLINYRIWRRFVVFLLLLTVGSLIAVLLFSDLTFGARRAFLEGSYQPGELAELTVVIYMSAWLSSKNRKVSSITHGLIPFAMLIGVIGGLVALQPDLSTTVTIFVVAGIMYFLAGANILHLVGALGLMGAAGYIITENFVYAQDRVGSYIAGLTDLTQTNYHAQQAIIAFLNGGWTGVGLGQGKQKFGFLPTPHTDSIFAVIGEELGFIGAMFVITLFVLLVIRGLQIARRAHDPFGSLLSAGITLWIITKAMMNIAVMLNLIPSTGVALPFISYGGSSLITLMAGAGLLFSVARVTALENSPEGRKSSAHDDRGWGNRWTRLSGDSRRRSDQRSPSRR